MFRAFAIFIISCAVFSTAHAAAQTPDVTLSLLRAVRLSNTSITLSFKTDTETIGQVRYAQPGGSEIQLTDSAPQTDHLFTITELDPSHGYSFTLSASSGHLASNDYVVLLAPSSIGNPGESIMPGAQVMADDGSVITTTLTASTAPRVNTPVVPWWVFVILFVVVVGSWVGYGVYQRKHTHLTPS